MVEALYRGDILLTEKEELSLLSLELSSQTLKELSKLFKGISNNKETPSFWSFVEENSISIGALVMLLYGIIEQRNALSHGAAEVYVSLLSMEGSRMMNVFHPYVFRVVLNLLREKKVHDSGMFPFFLHHFSLHSFLSLLFLFFFFVFIDCEIKDPFAKPSKKHKKDKPSKTIRNEEDEEDQDIITPMVSIHTTTPFTPFLILLQDDPMDIDEQPTPENTTTNNNTTKESIHLLKSIQQLLSTFSLSHCGESMTHAIEILVACTRVTASEQEGENDEDGKKVKRKRKTKKQDVYLCPLGEIAYEVLELLMNPMHGSTSNTFSRILKVITFYLFLSQ
jgi:hypothetical protein